MLRLVTERLDDPAADTGLSTAILRGVASGALEPTLRLHVPGRVVAFGSQDATSPGYGAAAQAAAALGYAPIARLAGGKAAVFHEATLAFAWATPHADPKVGIEARYEELGEIVVAALEQLGVAAEIGEVPGEYCPGRFSAHVAGKKVMGVGQRLVKGAAHVGGVIVLDRPDLVNQPLVDVYEKLGYEWDPGATGATGTGIDETTAALVDAFAAVGHATEPIELSPDLTSSAQTLAERHRLSIA